MPILIAEIGCNHKGDMSIAKDLIATAAMFCKVDVVKFQKRTVRELLTDAEYNAPHPNPMHSFGDSYGKHREFLEFDVNQHRKLIEWCEQVGVGYATSVWDSNAAKEMTALKPSMLKIPSASNLDFEMLGWLCDNFAGEIHVSLGMTDRKEEEQILRFFESKERNMDVVLYACTSGYPVPFEDICLLEVERLKHAYGSRVKSIGFSGHHLGIAADIGAMVLGATVFERHFTLDRTWKGTDHAASLEPDGMRRLKRDLENVTKALNHKDQPILAIEAVQRKKLKRKVHV